MNLVAVQSALTRRNGESAEEHQSFLIYAATAPDKRSKALTGRIHGISAPMIRYRDTKWAWAKRLLPLSEAGIDGEREAIFLYADLYGANELIRKRLLPELRVPYPEQGVAQARREQILALQATKQQEQDFLEAKEATSLDDALKRARQQFIGRISKQGAQVTVADLERLERMAERHAARKKEAQLLERAPKETVAQSDRVLRALAQHQDPLPAMQEDLLELQAILGGLASQQAAPEVFPLRSTG